MRLGGTGRQLRGSSRNAGANVYHRANGNARRPYGNAGAPNSDIAAHRYARASDAVPYRVQRRRQQLSSQLPRADGDAASANGNATADEYAKANEYACANEDA